MAKRVVKYGLKEEVLEKAKKFCQRNLSDDWCKEFNEELKNEAKRILAVLRNRK
jgi:hypothetical protein